MPRAMDSASELAHVNVLKKVKVSGTWILCPAVLEANGRLKDRVRVHGRVEVHGEGVYYIEWREAGRRRRKAIPNRAEVLERARLKTLELTARRSGATLDAVQSLAAPGSRVAVLPAGIGAATVPSSGKSSTAAQLLLKGIEAYLQEVVGAAVRSQLASLGMNPDEGTLESPSVQHRLTASSSEEVPAQEGPAVAEGSVTAPPASGEITIAAAIESYLKEVEPPQREPKTYEKYRNVLYRFRDNCKKVNLKDIDRNDCLEFKQHLYSIGNEARTVYNLIIILQQWLKLNGITGLLQKRDKPKYVVNMRKMYAPEDLEALFRACNPDERIRYLFFLLTGERDQEVRNTTWPDIDFNRKCVRVTAKKHLRFKPKDKEEREIPVASSLLSALREYRDRQTALNPHDLVFPTSNGRPDKKFENKLKKIAYGAGLNCGRCLSKHGNQCSEGPYCGKWFLHKFRHTFATNSLEAGVSIRTLQEWLGHSDLASTMIYLKYVGREGVQELLDKSAMAEYASNSLSPLSTSEVALNN